MSLGFNLGQPTSSSALPAFGTATNSFSFGGTAAQPQQSAFGAPVATASVAPLTGLSFGQPAASTAAPLNFAGATAATPSAFGMAPAATSAVSTGFTGFGMPASSVATSLPNFGAAPASSAPSLFGAPTSAATTTPATGFSGFGAFTAAAAVSQPQPTLGGGNTSNASTGGLFGSKPLGAPATSAPAPTTTTFTGLGGPAVTLTSSAGGLGSDEQKQDKAVKDQDVHPVIMQSIDDFKAFVKLQKNIASDITRSSCRPSERVDDDIEILKQRLFSIRNHIQSYSSQAKKIKTESSRTLGHAEMAQQTQDIVPSMQDKHFAPDEYFIEIVNGIEEELQLISQEVDSVERVVHSAAESSALKKEELVQAVKRLHEIFITVASKLQQVHGTVEQKKEQYLLLRQQLLHDTTDIFQSLQRARQGLEARSTGLSGGPSLFSSIRSAPSAYSAPAATPIRPTFAAPLSFGSTPSAPAAETTAFQLQQPPLGNKRGKH